MWMSHTRCFPQHEIDMLYSTPAKVLAGIIVRSSPLVLLRYLAEVMLNGDEAKLMTLLKNRRVKARMRGYEKDPQYISWEDGKYAKWLDECPQAVCRRRINPVQARGPQLPVLHLPVAALNYPNQMQADDTSFWSPQAFKPGTRIILRCDQVRRPYLPQDSYYESGVVQRCGDELDGRYLISFKHDRWPEVIYIDGRDSYAIQDGKINQVEGPLMRQCEPGTVVLLKYAKFRNGTEDDYYWAEVLKCVKRDMVTWTGLMKVLPKPF